MTRPGDRLRAFAARWCSADTIARVVDPLIADLQHEHAEAARTGHIWKSRWIQAAGWIAFLQVIVVCAWRDITSAEQWTPDDRKLLARAAVITAVTTVVITVLLVSRSAEDIPQVLVHPSPTRLLFLAPYPFVAGLVLGATLGIALGCGGHALSRRLVAAAVGGALICSALVFVDVGWVAPAAHIAYRSRVGYSDVTTLDVGEASLGVLHWKIEQVRRESEDAPSGFLAGLSFDYHRRVAVSFSPLVFTVFALAMAGCLRRQWVIGIAACATFLGYGWLLMNVVPWNLQPWNLRAPVYVAAWLPNATIAAMAAVLGILSARQPSRRLPANGQT